MLGTNRACSVSTSTAGSIAAALDCASCLTVVGSFLQAWGGQQHLFSNAAGLPEGRRIYRVHHGRLAKSTSVDGTCRARPVFVQGSPAPSPLSLSGSSTSRTLSNPLLCCCRNSKAKTLEERVDGVSGLPKTLPNCEHFSGQKLLAHLCLFKPS